MSKCFWCDGTGKFKQPKDQEEFDRRFDYYDKPGAVLSDCRKKALEDVGYDVIECPYCDGSGVEDK